MTATDAEITAALSTNADVRFRYERRDRHYNYKGELDGVVAGSIWLDNTAAIRKAADFTLIPDLANLDIINDFIAPVEDILINGVWETFPMGLFSINSPDEEYNPNSRENWEIAATDLTSLLLDKPTEYALTVTSGTNYLVAVKNILDELDLLSELPTTSHSCPVDFTWSADTPYLTVINDLLFAINHHPISPNLVGVFTTSERIDPSTKTEAISYEMGQMISPPFQRRRDRTRYANRITVKIEDPLRTPGGATKNNNDSSSSISQAVTGHVTPQELEGGRVINSTVAGEIAAYELRWLASREWNATLTTVFDPRRRMHENYRVTIEGVESNSLWIVRGWRGDLRTGGKMVHELQKSIPITVT